MPVFFKPFLGDLPGRAIRQLDEPLAPLERLANVMQRNLLVAEFDDHFQVEPVNARGDT